ncbi:hypothetical protein BG842_05020 [Haladaptatus sp. W1]|nr:hypothetical protein BG842_05020 [Haladaptatus sp. W1]
MTPPDEPRFDADELLAVPVVSVEVDVVVRRGFFDGVERVGVALLLHRAQFAEEDVHRHRPDAVERVDSRLESPMEPVARRRP